MTRRAYTRDGATVWLDLDVNAVIAEIVNRVSAGLLASLEGIAHGVVTSAEARWYSREEGVMRRTGRTGQFEVRTVLSDDEIRVSIWPKTMDAFYVHRRGPLALIPRFFPAESGRAAWWEAKKMGKATRREVGGARRWIVYEPHPHRSDGKYLFQEMVAKPFRAAIKALPEDVRRTLKLGRGGGGRISYRPVIGGRAKVAAPSVAA